MPNGERKFLGDVIVAVDSAVRRMLIQDTEGRNGGMFRLYRIGGFGEPQIVFTSVHGVPNEKKLARYLDLSAEKARRLADNRTAEHFSSWQSRAPKEDRWGGAIVTPDGKFILSFSGLPELADEAVCILVAVDVGLLTREEALAIGKISENSFLFTEWGSGLHQV